MEYSGEKPGKNKYTPKKAVKILLYCVEIIQILLGIVFFAYFYKMNMWPIKYLVYVFIITVVVLVAVLILKRWKWGCIVSLILSTAIIVVQCIGCYYVYITNNTLNKITGSVNKRTNIICVLVLKDNEAESIEDAKDYTFGILDSIDRDNTDATISKINDKVGKEIETEKYDNYLNLAASLYSGNADAIIINNAFVDIISDFDGYTNFEYEIKSIFSNVITEEETTVEEPTTEQVSEEVPFDITKDTFHVYLSGIDTTGDVTTKSRSDVNIIMSINPTTRQILLLSTPRDYYVPLSISNGVKDKLTHAGLYGVEVSMETLEMLYGIDIDYFVRMNFTGFTDIVNALGGIEVYSEYSFSADGFYYNSGYNTLNGEAALRFARERHSFASGDNQRGKNQMEVIKAVIYKVENSNLLDDYAAILNSVSNCMQTNMTTKEISKLVKMQLNTETPWNVVSYSVTGMGQSQYTYTVPGMRAYVMEPDTETVNSAKALLKRVEAGKKLKQTEE